MNGYSTITQKGQVAIPKPIRDEFQLKPFDRIYFTVEKNKIVAEPVSETKDMRGFIQTQKSFSKVEMKTIIRKRIVKKHENRS